MSPSATIIPFPQARHKSPSVAFSREELSTILTVYGRMVAAGEWRDYAIHHGEKEASFAAFRRASDRPACRIVKDPALKNGQGVFRLVGADGRIIRRGHDLHMLLRDFQRKLMKSVY